MKQSSTQQGLREKFSRCLLYLQSLKQNSKMIPFLQPQQIQRLGLYDFRFINKKTINLSTIEQKLKENKYVEFDEFINDLKLVFQIIGYYVPLNDPLQADVKYFISQVDKWKVNCIQNNGNIDDKQIKSNKKLNNQSNINNNKQDQYQLNQKPNIHTSKYKGSQHQHYQTQRKKKIQNYAKIQQQKQKLNPFTKAYKLPLRSSLAQKIQMIYFLKSHQLNQPFIRNIGDIYGIGKDVDDQYVIKLDNSTSCAWLEVLNQNSNNGEYYANQKDKDY